VPALNGIAAASGTAAREKTHLELRNIRDPRNRILNDLLGSKIPHPNSAVQISAYAGRGNDVRRETARANWLALAGEGARAATVLARCAVRSPLDPGPRVSLGFLLTKGLAGNASGVWDILRTPWRDLRRPDDLNAGSFGFFALGVEAAMACGSAEGERAVRDVYLPYFHRNESMGRAIAEPFLLWHVPKTGGTSVTTTVARHFYVSGMSSIPSYTAGHFLRWIVQHQDGLFPFLSSSHLSSSELGLQQRSSYREMLVLRDPVSRALSAWRQYRSRPRNRLWTLPQHGAVWRYFPTCSLAEWSLRVPEEAANPYAWTFGDGVARLRNVEFTVQLPDLDGFAPSLGEILGVELGGVGMRASKNVTDRRIAFHPEELAVLHHAVRRDQTLLRALPGYSEP